MSFKDTFIDFNIIEELNRTFNMKLFRLLSLGFATMASAVASAFSVKPLPKNREIENLRSNIESYKYISDKQRLSMDYRNIGEDLHRAYSKYISMTQ